MKPNEFCECAQNARMEKHFCLKCERPTRDTDKKYREYLRLCELYGSEIALRLVYG